MARAAVECAYGGVRAGFEYLMVLSGKETGWISRRTGVVIVSEVCRYICVVDGYRIGR